MGIAIVCMVNGTQSLNSDRSLQLNTSLATENEKCMFSVNSNQNSKNELANGEFFWNKNQQGIILSAFFYGYILNQMFGGWISIKIGGKITASLSILLGSLCTLLIPISARNGFYYLVAVRFFTGFFHSAWFPSLGSIWVNWLPPNEKSRLLGLASSGSYIGSTLALPFGSFLCINGFDSGWPSIFYIFGAIGVIWSILFMIFNSEKPEDHKFISEKEIDYILEATEKNHIKKKLKTPWKAIFTSKICLALNLCTFCNNTGNYLYLTQIPTYVNEVLKFDIQNNGLVSSLPYICTFVVINLSSQLSDFLMRKNIMKKISIRKMYTSIGMISPALCLLGLTFVTCKYPYIGVFLLTAGYACTGFTLSGGFLLSIYEIAGPFSSLIIGMTNGIGTLPGIIAPSLVGFLTKNRKQEEWRNVFIITAIAYLIGFLTFSIWGDSDLQPWAVEENVEENDIEKEPLEDK